MRILFIHNRYRQPGGEDTAVELETRLLQQRGHEVELLLFDNESPKGLLSPVHATIDTVYNKTSARKVKKAIHDFQPQIVHVHNFFFKASPAIFYAAHALGIPVVVTLHNYRLICCNALLLRNGQPCELCTQQVFPFSGIRYRCYRHSTAGSAVVTFMTGFHKKLGTWKNRVDRFIVLNEFAKNKLLHSSLQCPETAFFVKPNFVHDEGTGAWPREEFYFFAGRISGEKGVSILAEAFSGLRDIPLVIAGLGPDLEYLQKKYQDYPNIHFAGPKKREEIIALMKKCRALVFPSVWYEGLPFVILEAFSTGTPVIASRTGSMTEMIEDGYNGYHFNPGDAGDLQQKIQRFEAGVGSNENLYSNARQTWLNRYHPDVHYDSVIKLYGETIAHHNNQL